ncbi:MAG: LCP family protein [Firmicutes bacterium]|nr:LCP family protein [Bacillota bacterium]
MSNKYNDFFDGNDNGQRISYDDVELFDLSRRRRQIDAIHQHINDLYDFSAGEDEIDMNDDAEPTDEEYYSYEDENEDYLKSEDTSERNKSEKSEINFDIGKFVKYVLIAAVLCVIISMILLHSAISKVNYVEIDTDWNDSPSADAPAWALRSKAGITNILLLGIDGDGGENQRSDTIMLLTLDKTNGEIKLTSILRDTYVSIPGRNKKTRINHSYAFGGAALTMQTIESNFRIDIDRYIGIDMDGLTVVVDKLGGVDMTITAAEAKQINSHVKGSSLTEGTHHLNGAQATYYARIRKIDSDFGRTKRQRKLIKAMLAEIKNSGITELYSLADEVAPYLTTNYTEAELISLALNAAGLIKSDIQEMSVPVKGMYKAKTISGMAVLVPDIQKNCEKMHKFIFGDLPA